MRIMPFRNYCQNYLIFKLGSALLSMALTILVYYIPVESQGLPPESTKPEPQVFYPEAPPSGYYVLHTIGKKPRSSLRVMKVLEKKNKITDTEEWWVGNRLLPMTYQVPNPYMQKAGDLPPVVPLEFLGQRVVKVLRSNPILAIYGDNFGDGRYLLVIDPENGKIERAFDFSAYQWPHKFNRAEKDYIKMSTTWAYLEDDILYVQHNHKTYARSSKGYNAYLSALDIRTGMLLWRSKPLVANANNFLVKDGAIITGYGFTAEPDFLYVLNKTDGRILQKVAVKSAPEYLVEKDDKLFVRTYHTDYVFNYKK